MTTSAPFPRFPARAGQREMPVKMAHSSSLRRILAALVLPLALISLDARGEDGGIPADAPVALKLANGSVLMNKQAFEATDAEMKRLQALEKNHKAESWVTVFLVGLAAGALAGAAVAVPVTLAVTNKPSK